MTPYLWASQVYNSFFREKHEKLPSSGKNTKSFLLQGKTRKASFFREKNEKLLIAATSEHVP
jgi:hypothetical protein